MKRRDFLKTAAGMATGAVLPLSAAEAPLDTSKLQLYTGGPISPEAYAKFKALTADPTTYAQFKQEVREMLCKEREKAQK